MRKKLFHHIGMILAAYLLIGFSSSVQAQTVLATENFEGTPSGWFTSTFSGSNSSTATVRNQWGIVSGGNAITNISAQVCYTLNNGSTYTIGQYTSTTPATGIILYKQFSSAGYNSISVQFDWKCRGENNYDYGQLYYATSAAGPWTQVATNIRTNSSGTNNNTYTLPAGANNNANLHIAWVFRADGSVVNQPGFIVDNITVRGTAIPTPPANDLVSNAINISCGQTLNGTTVNATADATSPCASTLSAPGVWYKVTGNGQLMTASTCGLTSNDTRLQVYSGTTGSLNCVGSSDDACSLQSSVSWTSVSGTTYYILAGLYSGTGTFGINLNCVNPPSADFTFTAPFSHSGYTCGAGNNCSFDTSDDLQYAINVSNACSYTFSLCGSSYDTKMYLTSALCGGTSIASNDDFCGLSSQFTVSLTPGTYYLDIEGFAGACGSYALNVTQGFNGAAGAISGATSICTPVSGSYSIASVSGASAYIWSVPAGVSIVSGQGTNTVNLSFSSSFNSGSISVLPTSNCGNGTSSSLTINATSTDYSFTAPFSHSGNTCGMGNNVSLRSGEEAYYEIVIPYSCNWTFSTCGSSFDTYIYLQDAKCGGNTVISNDDFCSLSSQFTTFLNAGTYYLAVEPYSSSCGTYTLNVSSTYNGVAGTISGPSIVCDNSNQNYSIAAVAGASSYMWVVPTGVNIVSGQGTNSVNLQFTSGFTSGNITVLPSSGCGSGVSSSKQVAYSNISASSTATSIACNGGTATITVTGNGGAAPYSGTGNFTVTAGTYNYTVTDANGCSASTSITVAQPSALTATSSATSIACNGGTSTVTVSGNGGTAPYSGTGSFTVTAGTYNYTVTDANGCTATTSITVTEPALLQAYAASSSILCNGGTATVTVGANYGTAPYSGTGNFTVTAGTYNYIVTDANGCTATTSITVTEPALLQAYAANTPILCNGGTATVGVTFSGGTGVITGIGNYTVTAGTYNYNIMDSNGCTASTSITVTEPSLLTAASTATSIACYGGSATVTVTGNGGTAPYSGTGNFTVTAGTYNYTVIDANGCSATTSITVSEPSLLTAASTATSIACFGGSATVTVTGNGGTAPYSGTGNFTVTAGTYNYTVTDANGCSATTSITVSEPSLLTAASTATSIACFGGSATVTVTGNGGTAPYSGTGNFTVTAGTYNYTVTDANGCTATTSITVTEPALLQAYAANTPILCNGGTATVGVTFSGGTGVITGIGNYTVTAGTYNYNIMDSNGCTASTSITVTEPSLLTAASTATSIACYGGSATVTVTGNGGTAPYSGTGNFTVTAGTYNYTVIDANGCSATTSITITQPTALVASSIPNQTVYYGYTPMSCANLSASATGGTGAYTYNWNTGANSSSITVCPNTSSNYNVIITDANGCTAISGATVCVVDVRCYAGNSNVAKVEICHIPPGNTGNPQVICVSASAVAAHLAHGDALGSCTTNHACNPSSHAVELFEDVHGNNDMLEVKLYPNPTAENANLELGSDIDNACLITIYDINGRLVKQMQSIELAAGISRIIDLEIDGLNKGTYFINVRDVNENSKSVILIKQ